MADVLPDGIRKIFDDADAQTVRWRRFCRQAEEGAAALSEFVQKAQREPAGAQNFALMVCHLAGFAALQAELIKLIGNKS